MVTLHALLDVSPRSVPRRAFRRACWIGLLLGGLLAGPPAAIGAETAPSPVALSTAPSQTIAANKADLAQVTIDALKTQIDQLNGQIAKACSETKARIKQRLVELRADHDRRAAKLREAGSLIKEALAA